MPSTAEYCAIGETTTRFFSVDAAQRENGVNIGGIDCLAWRARSEGTPDRSASHCSNAATIVRIALAQVFVRDALRAREQRVSELLGLERCVARDVLEPFRRIARGVLDAQHVDAARLRCNA